MTSSNTPPAGAAGRRRGPYAKTAEVRQKILEACVEAFGTSGFHGATMRDIAQRAGISQTGLMHHFPEKSELLIEVLKMRDAMMSSIISDVGDEDFFEAQLRVIRDNEEHPGLMQLHSMIASEATDVEHPAHGIYAQRYDDLRMFLTQLFDEEKRSGRVAVEADSVSLANLFVAALDGLQLQWLFNPEAVDIEASISALLNSLRGWEDPDTTPPQRGSAKANDVPTAFRAR